MCFKRRDLQFLLPMLRCEFAVSHDEARACSESASASGPTGLLGERGTVSPAGDLDFSGSYAGGAMAFGHSARARKFLAMLLSVIAPGWA
jgi:hypothetical protein